MAPGGGGKRKRGDRSYMGDGRDEGSRPSPHRPESLTLGQQSSQYQNQQGQSYGRENYDHRGGGRRRASRGGRGGVAQHSPLTSPSGPQTQPHPTNVSPKNVPSSFPPPTKPLPETKSDIVSPAPGTRSTAPQMLEEAQPELTPYEHEYITTEILTNWRSSGKEKFVGYGIEARASKDALKLGLLFQESIMSVVDRRLEAAEIGAALGLILFNEGQLECSPHATADEAPFDASSLFLDCLSIYVEGSSATPALRDMVVATGIPPLQIRRELDSALLENLGMIRSTFVRMGIRQQTNLLYRQSNYNLLREETEGYSKLLTELFTTSSNEPPTSEVVEETFERVKGMIGAFDLDVGRVLDITLDVFAAVLVKQYRFFVKYLRASSWWPQDKSAQQVLGESVLGPLPRWALPGPVGCPLDDEEKEAVHTMRMERDRAFWKRSKDIGMAAYFEIGGRRVEDSILTAAANSKSGNFTQDEEDRKWIEITKTLPPAGNKVAAQVLGFKLRFYSSSARDLADVLPVNLIYLAALLIKVGFISLRDLYPHIWPADLDMERLREEKMKEKIERDRLNRPGGGAMNALLAAAPLSDDTLEGKTRESIRLRELDAARRHLNKGDQSADRSTPTPQAEEKIDQLPEPLEQKVQLLKSLLCIGAIPEALYMLGRFSWLADAFPELHEHIHRILHHSLSKVYEPSRPLQTQSALRSLQKIPDPDQLGAAKGQVKLIDASMRKTMRWAQLDKEDTNEAIDYKFYWDDWADNVPVCQSVDDVFILCSTLLNFTGVKIGLDPTLLLKLARIGSDSLRTDTSDFNKARWIDLSRRLIVPALSFTKCNPGLVNEVFELINQFSTATRYSIYAEWNSGQTSRLPDMKTAFDQAKAETKDVLKRISKTTIRPMARALAKIAYANPGIVFSVAIAQLESYENIVDAVVECARYFTDLAYDVLTWSLTSALGSTGRNRVQANGMLTSKWLAALSLFAGKVFKRYSILSPTPVVQYVADQLRRGNSTDLIILEEITKSMAGIISDTNFNEAQVTSMGGGELLQAQILLQLLDRRHESKITADRLMKSLTDSKLAGQLLVSLAQERQMGMFRIEEQNAHPKLLGNLFDQLHRILVQYLDLLRSNLSVQDFDTFVPNVARLIGEFGIDPSVAFWISRPSINAAVLEHDAKLKKRKSDSAESLAKETETKDLNKTESTETSKITGDGKTIDHNEDNMDICVGSTDVALSTEHEVADVKISKDLPLISDPAEENWHPVLQDVMNAIRPALPIQTWEVVGLPFYVTYWHLSLSDFLPPLSSYTDELHRLAKKVQAINNDRSDISVAGTKRKEKEREGINALSDRLNAESKVRVNVYGKIRARILREKKYWFAGLWGKWDVLNVALIEHCFFPRILMSPLDALYTFRIFTFLHSNGATNFRTMGVLDQFFREKRLTSMMFLCSAKEAENLGRFFNEILRLLSRWHADKLLFEKEAFGIKRELPGFTMKMSGDKSQYTFIDYEDFRRILLKWHRNLSSAIKNCISSGEYMHIRNAVNVLNNIHQYFPAVNWMGQNLLNSITDLHKSESREDLKVAAMSLMGALKRREKDWMIPQAFNLAPTENGASAANGTRSASGKPSTPQPSGDIANALNPKAPDFRPNPRSLANGLPKLDGSSDKVEAEDGEIEDAKMTEAPVSISLSVDAAHSPPSQISANVAKSADQQTLPSIISEASKHQQKESSGTKTSAADDATLSDARPDIKPTLPGHIMPPSRPDLTRPPSSGPSNGRPAHNLPSKPEPSQVRPSDHRVLPRTGDRITYDHAREHRFPERMETRDAVRDRGFDRSVSDSYSHSTERAQGMERDRIDQRWSDTRTPLGRSDIDDRHSGSHGRDSRYMGRDDRSERPAEDRLYSEQHLGRRDLNAPLQQPKDTTMPPPRSTVSQHPINPERAALIHGSQPHDRGHSHGVHPDRRSDGSRYDNQPRSERSSRGPSPTRSDSRQNSQYDTRREDAAAFHGRRPNEDAIRPTNSRFEEPHAPTGPRTGRPANTGLNPLNPNDRFRESMKPSAVAPPIDPNHGRLSQESNFPSRQVESQYGRLNSESDIPSGPRMPNGNNPVPPHNGRNVSAPQPRLNTQLPPQAQGTSNAIHDRQAPSGPSLRGSPRKPPPFSQHHGNSSAPTTPMAQSPDTAGIHPDRLKALQGSGAVTAESATHNLSGPRHGPPPIAMPPRGPTGTQLTSPIGPTANNRGPPTGPAMPNDRSGRDKRTFAGIQTVLQQASGSTVPERTGQGASIRGRGGRANNMNGPSSGTSAPATPSLPRQDQPLFREDLFAGNLNGSAISHQLEDDVSFNGGGRRGISRDDLKDGDRQNGRHRSRSPVKDRSVGGPFRTRDDELLHNRDGMRDRPRGNEGLPNRDLRSGSGPPEANIRGSGGFPDRDLRDRGPLRDTRRSGRDDGQYRDRRGEPDIRDDPDRRDDRDRRDGGGSGRKRGRGGDEGQGERNFSDSKRPRR